jgi:flagellar assembly protein FliH
MVKALFKPGEIAVTNAKVLLNDPLSYHDEADKSYPPTFVPTSLADTAPIVTPEVALPPVEEYKGPTADDLRREADEFRTQWEQDKQDMMNRANDEAAQIVSQARVEAEARLEEARNEAEAIKKTATDAAKAITDEAEKKAKDISKDAKDLLKKDRDAAKEEGRKEGREEAWKTGQDEAVRLVQRLRTVLEKTQDQRKDILASTENQVVQLALLVARKVIRTLAENQEGVVIDTVKEALAKVKGRGKIVIRVNTADMNLTSAHTGDFVKMLEGIDSVEVQEDSTVGVGGCLVETDFGEIDARITSQMAELEGRIMALSPIRGKA